MSIEPTIELKLERLFEDTKLPIRQTEGSAGYDVHAYVREHTIQVIRRDGTMETRRNKEDYFLLTSRSRALISLGFKATFTPGFEAQIRPRSGRAWGDGLQIMNSPGTIDSDYPGEWKVMLFNPTPTNIKIGHGERIAQLIFNRIETVRIEEFGVQQITSRTGGFGSTGE